MRLKGVEKTIIIYTNNGNKRKIKNMKPDLLPKDSIARDTHYLPFPD